MAKRRRKAKTRTITRYIKAKKRRTKSSNKNAMLNIFLGGVVYGGFREYTSNKLAEYTNGKTSSFIGEYSDELTMGVISYLLARGKIPYLNKIKMSRDIGKAGLYIESARIGNNLIANRFNNQANENISQSMTIR